MVVIRPFGFLGYSPVSSTSVSLPAQEVSPTSKLYLSTQLTQTASVYRSSVSPVAIATTRSGTGVTATPGYTPMPMPHVALPYGRTTGYASGTDPGAPVEPASPGSIMDEIGPTDAFQGETVATDLATGTMSDADRSGPTTSDLDSIFRRVPWWAWAAAAGVGAWLILR